MTEEIKAIETDNEETVVNWITKRIEFIENTENSLLEELAEDWIN